MRIVSGALALLSLALVGVAMKPVLTSAPASGGGLAPESLAQISTYDLHLHHPNMTTLPRQEAPLP